jgi:hypothetical protein
MLGVELVYALRVDEAPEDAGALRLIDAFWVAARHGREGSRGRVTFDVVPCVVPPTGLETGYRLDPKAPDVRSHRLSGRG